MVELVLKDVFGAVEEYDDNLILNPLGVSIYHGNTPIASFKSRDDAALQMFINGLTVSGTYTLWDANEGKYIDLFIKQIQLPHYHI